MPFPPLEDLPIAGIEPVSPASPASAADSFTAEPRGELSLSIVLCSVTQSCLILCDPMDFSLPGSSVQGILQARICIGVGCHALLQGIFPTQGSNGSPTLQVDSLPSEPPGKPKNTGVGNLSLLQGIFLAQELNWGLALQADSLPAELPGKL